MLLEKPLQFTSRKLLKRYITFLHGHEYDHSVLAWTQISTKMKITKKILGLILSDSMVEQKVTDDKNVSVLNHEYFNPSYQYRAITVLNNG